MKNILITASLLISGLWSAQQVTWNEVAGTHNNSDKFLYRITETTGATYLGEVEVQGFTTDDAAVFGKVYEKAREVGANVFFYQPFQSIDESESAFDPAHYKLRLYYLSPERLPKDENTLYIYASPARGQKISFNKEEVYFEPRTFTKRKLMNGDEYILSTRKLLGSSVRFSVLPDSSPQFFQLHGFHLKSSPYGAAGINLKSGDIIRLERSFADFLSVIYREF